jgi:hypothetical protein
MDMTHAEKLTAFPAGPQFQGNALSIGGFGIPASAVEIMR